MDERMPAAAADAVAAVTDAVAVAGTVVVAVAVAAAVAVAVAPTLLFGACLRMVAMVWESRCNFVLKFVFLKREQTRG